MHRKFHEKMGEMLRRDAPFVVATVINVRGSAVAKPGARAIIDEEGRPVFGWVGGGCVESFVCAAAREALFEGAPRIITADLEDELSGVGLPCGGVMEIFIEPVAPRRRVLVLGASKAGVEASRLLERAGFAVTHDPEEIRSGSLIILAPAEGEDPAGLRAALEVETDYLALLSPAAMRVEGLEQLQARGIEEEPLAEGAHLCTGLDLGGASPAELALRVVAELLAVIRGAKALPLQETKLGEPALAIEAVRDRRKPAIVIIGHSSITEELAWLAAQLGWRVSIDSATAPEESYPPTVNIVRDDADFSRLPTSADTAVIVATHHKGDHTAIERAFSAGAWYVGLIASAHRSRLVREMLGDSLNDRALVERLRTPAGLDLGATTPAEIALSIMSEVLACFYGRTGRHSAVAQSLEESRR